MKGIIINWIDTLASIPADWLLCDGNNSTPNLLGKYLLSVGTGENPGTTGGSTTHTHTSPEHTHTQDAHSHTGNTDNAGGGYGISNATSLFYAGNHNHPFTTSSTIATNQVTQTIVDAISNDPPFYKIAPIIDNSIVGIKYPISSLIFWDKTSLPVGWILCDGSEGTPDLRNKFLKCVDSTENPGSSGGNSTHTHTTTSHTHTQDTHTHSGTTGTTTPFYTVESGGSQYQVRSSNTHTHSLTINSVVATNQSSLVTMDSINGEPTFKKLLIIKNTGVANRPKYSIVMWSGTIANIPLGYVLCNGTNGTPNLLNYFIKGALDSSELENTGGSAIHGHTANSHTHTQDAHSHTISANSGGGDVAPKGTGNNQSPPSHTHTVSNTNATATNQATTITVDDCTSQANYPPYYKVAYIMQDRELDIGAYAFMVN